jgi:hypothetical protein
MRVPLRRGPTGNSYMHLHGDGKVVLEKEFDRTPVLEHAALMRNQVQQRGELRKVMSVPAALIHQWIAQGKLGEQSFVDGSLVIDKAKLEQLFNDPDNALLRTVDKL